MNIHARKRLYVFDLDDTVPGAKDVLSLLEGVKILVTAGDETVQRQKIGLVGIRLGLENIFSEVHIVGKNENKEDIFRSIAKRYGEREYVGGITKGRHIVVVGNRIDSEIYYGNLLGFTTVRLLHGSYAALKPTNSFHIPRYTIRNLRTLLDLPFLK